MRGPLPSVTLRDVVPGDAPALANILVTANRHAFSGVVPERCLSLSQVESAANWQRFLGRGLEAGHFMLIAQAANGTAVGYAWGRPASGDFASELKQINVLPGNQRQGLGRLLVGAVAQRLARQERDSMFVEVLQDNPNRPFYERIGAKFVSERPHDWEGVSLPMYKYGWQDTRPLYERLKL